MTTEPPYADPLVRWCGRAEPVRVPPMPILDHGRVRSGKVMTKKIAQLRNKKFKTDVLTKRWIRFLFKVYTAIADCVVTSVQSSFWNTRQ